MVLTALRLVSLGGLHGEWVARQKPSHVADAALVRRQLCLLALLGEEVENLLGDVDRWLGLSLDLRQKVVCRKIPLL